MGRSFCSVESPMSLCCLRPHGSTPSICCWRICRPPGWVKCRQDVSKAGAAARPDDAPFAGARQLVTEWMSRLPRLWNQPFDDVFFHSIELESSLRGPVNSQGFVDESCTNSRSSAVSSCLRIGFFAKRNRLTCITELKSAE